MVAMHGRPWAQMYEGKANWDIFGASYSELKTIPFVGNGDVRTPEELKYLLDTTGRMVSWWGVPLWAIHG